MRFFEVTFTECAIIEADDEQHAIRIARENVHIYAEDDAYYKVEEIKDE